MWDSEMPSTMKHKLTMLLERRDSLKEEQMSIAKKELINKHKQSILKQSNEYQQTVECLLDDEKSQLINVLDQELVNNNASRRHSNKRMPTLEQSTISFQEQSAVFHVHKSSHQTNRSASTNVSCFNTHSPGGNDTQIYGNNTNNFNSSNNFHNSNPKQNQNQNNQMKKLEYTINEQTKQNQLQQLEILQLRELNGSLNSKIELLEKTHQRFQMQTELFKENLITKLNSYAQKLTNLNENEEKLLQIQQENARLKQEKEELVMILNKRIH